MTTPDHERRAAGPPPSWLVEPCPPWCVRDHREDDHPEDRYHQGEATIVPVVAGRTDAIPLAPSLEATDVIIRQGRHVGESRSWLAIESDDQPGLRLLLSLESARSLTAQLVRHLGIDQEP